MIKISKRLEKVASYIIRNDYVLDVGTDHGLLPMYLIKKGIINEAIASDIVPSIVASTTKAVREKGLDKSIKVVLSDGLKNIKDKDITTIVIAGMGGILISDILKQRKDYIKNKRLVLSPHRDDDIVRKTLHELGFKITDEDVLEDKENKFYHFIIASSGEEKKYKDEEYILGKKLLSKKYKNKELIKYLKYLIKKNNNIITKLKKAKNAQEKISELEKENKMLNKYLGKENKKELK